MTNATFIDMTGQRFERLVVLARAEGMAHSREYKSWDQMRQRCTNPKHHAWKWYGGKGVQICAAWMDSFEAFLADMGQRPAGCDLDRINSALGYCPENCRWLDRRINSLRALPNVRAQYEAYA
jgi:hypothetical protein